MKKCILIISSICLSTILNAQLNVQHNGYRDGDVIIKQQIEKKDPGASGKNVKWDFSEISLINDAYQLSYSQPEKVEDSVYILGRKKYPINSFSEDRKLIVGTEHQTLYYYLQTKDSILLLGHENIAGKLEYTQPLLVEQFPAYYGIDVNSDYQTKGLYSGVESFATSGNLSQSIDAYGSLIMPDGKELNPVIRQKTVQTIKNEIKPIDDNTKNIDLGQELTSYKWYTQGYRYPIFEVITCKELSNEEELFSTSFFYPPQDHLYLKTDSANLALLDELWKYSKPTDSSKKEEVIKTLNKTKPITCTMYPNPVVDNLTIDYELKTESQVVISMSTMTGVIHRTVNKGMQSAGSHQEQISFTGLPVGVYLVKIINNDLTLTEKIIKK